MTAIITPRPNYGRTVVLVQGLIAALPHGVYERCVYPVLDRRPVQGAFSPQDVVKSNQLL